MSFWANSIWTLVAGVLASLLATILWFGIARWWQRRRQVRMVDAKILLRWEPTSPSAKTLEGAELSITNRSAWPVPEVQVLEPEWLNRHDEHHIWPGETRIAEISMEALQVERDPTDVRLVLLVKDDRGEDWVWIPNEGKARNLAASIRAYSRVFQAIVSKMPERVRHQIMRLPPRLLVWLWGYDPQG